MTVADPLLMAWLDTSDWGNAKRLVALTAGKLKWIEDAQLWASFDGRRFDIERGGVAAQRLAHQVIEHIDLEAEALGSLIIAKDVGEIKRRVGDWCTIEIAEERVKVLRAHAVKSGSAGMTAGMLRQARSFLAVMSDEFDVDPLAYNCLNGTLRFVEEPPGSAPHTNPADPGRASALGWTVRFDPHDPDDMLMQVADVIYDPDATCDFWCDRLKFLQPDPVQLKALQLLYGYSLTGLTSDQSFYVHQGVGNDGKSTTHNALGELHGDYYRHAGVKTFLDGGGMKSGSDHRSDLVRLKGDIRFVTCDEPKGRSAWDGETIKQVTGSLITARGANERKEVTYRPRFKLHPECNVIPRAPGDDKGFRRRFKLYQWTKSLPIAGEDGYIPIDQALARLRAERSGILNWLIAGAIEWLTTRTIPQPAAMAAVLNDFWADSSPLLEWLAERCETRDASASAPAKGLFDDYKAWFEERVPDGQAMTSTAFGRSLRDKQFSVFKDKHGNRWRRGIRLLSSAERDGLLGAAAPDDATPRPVQSAAEPLDTPGSAFDEDDVP